MIPPAAIPVLAQALHTSTWRFLGVHPGRAGEKPEASTPCALVPDFSFSGLAYAIETAQAIWPYVARLGPHRSGRGDRARRLHGRGARAMAPARSAHLRAMPPRSPASTQFDDCRFPRTTHSRNRQANRIDSMESRRRTTHNEGVNGKNITAADRIQLRTDLARMREYLGALNQAIAHMERIAAHARASSQSRTHQSASKQPSQAA